MSDALLIVILILATYRITRLITADSFPPAYWLRERVVLTTVGTRYEPIGELWQCNWCMSVWVAAAVIAVTDAATSVPLPILLWPAVAAGAAWLALLEEAARGSGDV